jgi:hypothetical protein
MLQPTVPGWFIFSYAAQLLEEMGGTKDGIRAEAWVEANLSLWRSESALLR